MRVRIALSSEPPVGGCSQKKKRGFAFREAGGKGPGGKNEDDEKRSNKKTSTE